MFGFNNIKTIVGPLIMIVAIIAINYFVWTFIVQQIKSMNGEVKNITPSTVCGNGICEDAVCIGMNCSLNENKKSCPKDCK